MTDTATKPAPAPVSVTAPPIKHVYCVHHGTPARAMCGTPRDMPVSSLRVIGRRYPANREMCVVCLDMAPRPCMECGG